MNFCIPKHLTQLFKEKIKSGEISPDKLSEMDSAQRHGYFASFLGENNALKVNQLFESKLLLKSQQQGILNWAKQVTGMKPEVMRDIVSRVNKMDTLLNPKDEKSFLEDIVAHKIGFTVTMKEASNISSLAKDISDKRQTLNEMFKDENYSVSEETPQQRETRLDYGRSKVEFDDYVNGLKDEAQKTRLSEYLKPSNYLKGISNVAGFAKSMKASLDNSVIGRQGLKVLLTNPKTWLKNSIQSFKDIADSFGGKEVLNEVRADVMSRPNALNGLYKKEGLAVGVREEAYPTHLPEKIPVLGKAFKASEAAFVAFQYRSRADIFDKYVEIAKESNADIKGIGQIANSLTGRGKLDKFGLTEASANTLNNVFFSPRFLSSNIDALTGHIASKDMEPFARKTAAINTVKIISGVAAVLAIAKAFDKDSVDFDSRSANFGKIKVGDTRFDVSAGMGAIVTLASRIITQSSKSSTSNRVTKLNSGKFGATTGSDVVVNFFENKLSPAGSIVKDLMNNKDFQGNKPTFLNEANNLLAPLPVTNYLELKNDPNSANILVAMLADELGISTNTYSKHKGK